MPVEQAKDRCWILSPRGRRAGMPDERDPDFWHWLSAAAARKQLRDTQDDRGLALEATQLAEPCWQVRCDGNCQSVLDEDNEYPYCFPTAARALSCARAAGWRETGDGQIFCEPDAPEEARTPRPAEQIPGQLTLDGNDAW
jgi:hypothetical protein